jgi:hypothetical protein
MSDFLKGNFKTKKNVQKQEQTRGDQINEEFERTALRRLGGSIAFVSRKGFVWKGEENESEQHGDDSGGESSTNHS